MGTRAIYIFEDEHEEVAVYKHYDGYPQGAADFIEEAKAYAWAFPRFEADEFAAAFVAANKDRKGGGVRLIRNYYKDRNELVDDHEWCDYYYVISYQPNHRDLWVEIWHMRDEWVLIDELTHTQMKEKYGRNAA
tara:strand:- start:612 stop:1013 length:402 start_codon:yes stop_codon:yes gene_type:complete